MDNHVMDNHVMGNHGKETEFVNKEDLNNLSPEKISYLEKMREYELSEKDFYPPEDTRLLKSNVYDISNGDNFADFTEYFFDMCYEEEYFDDM